MADFLIETIRFRLEPKITKENINLKENENKHEKIKKKINIRKNNIKMKIYSIYVCLDVRGCLVTFLFFVFYF